MRTGRVFARPAPHIKPQFGQQQTGVTAFVDSSSNFVDTAYSVNMFCNSENNVKKYEYIKIICMSMWLFVNGFVDFPSVNGGFDDLMHYSHRVFVVREQ